jgi:beta-lactamase regulating signal transducer with metallopeptidase domain
MPVYFVYMLKASACLSVIYLFYVLLLRNITYYTLNRYFLLLYCILASIIPLINVNVFIKANQFDGITFFDHLPSLSPSFTKINTPGFAGVSITGLLTGVFISGVFVMLLRLFIQLVSLWKMHLKATLLQDGKVRVYHIAEPIIPFSYFNNIYLNKHNYSEDELTEIVNHELAHVQQKHIIDILITEVICIFNWYNPIVWLLKKAVKENLEFIADDTVIKKGADKKCYQYLLLKVTGNVSFSIANNLNFLSLKSRIGMMNKTKTSAFHLLKFVMFVPMATILLLAFRNKQEVFTTKYTEQGPATKTYILSSLTYAIPDKKVEAVVKKEQDKSLFKLGKAMNFDLDLFLSEHDRLRALLQKSGYDLEKNGYKNTGKYGIIFMVDTTSGNNSLSVKVNINLTRDQLTNSRDELFEDGEISTHASNIPYSTNTLKPVFKGYNVQPSNRYDDKLVPENREFNSNLFGIK